MSIFDTRTAINTMVQINMTIRGIIINMAIDKEPRDIQYYLIKHTLNKEADFDIFLMNEDEMYQSYVLLLTNSADRIIFYQNAFMNLPENVKDNYKAKILKEAKKREIKKLENDNDYLLEVLEDYLCNL